jgi:hypothetical protein
MKIHWSLLILAGVLLAGVPLAMAGAKGQQAEQKEGMPIVLSDAVKIRGTVEAIDYDKRMATLRGPEGNTVIIKVNDDVRNFDQVQKGDEVMVEYYESVALGMRKPGQGPIEKQVEIVKVAPPGEKPGRFEMKTAEVTATVEAIDYDQRMVRLRGPEGDVLTVKVDDNVKNLEKVKPGDNVVARVTEAFAISVMKPSER